MDNIIEIIEEYPTVARNMCHNKCGNIVNNTWYTTPVSVGRISRFSDFPK